MVGEVGQLLAGTGFGRQLGASRGEPSPERQDQGLGVLLPHGAAPLGWLTRDRGLDAVELGDPAQTLLGNGRGVLVEQGTELPPGAMTEFGG